LNSRDRTTVAKDLAAKIAAAGMLSVAAAVASAATAAADPPPPVDPGSAPIDPAAEMPAQTLNDVLTPQMTGFLGVPAPTGTGAPVDFFLGQHPLPSVPGAQPVSQLDPNTAFSSSGPLLPQQFKLAAPDEGNMYSIGQGDVTDHPELIPALKGAHALWHGQMGRLTPDQLGEPLPGTAPPPGTNIPPGVVDFLPDPVPWPQAPPPAPEPPPAPPVGG
jgi:hypothetical protein